MTDLITADLVVLDLVATDKADATRQLAQKLADAGRVTDLDGFLADVAAREAQMAYATVGLVTDYDCWLDDPAQHANVATIFERYGQTLATARSLLDELLRGRRDPLPADPQRVRVQGTADGHDDTAHGGADHRAGHPDGGQQDSRGHGRQGTRDDLDDVDLDARLLLLLHPAKSRPGRPAPRSRGVWTGMDGPAAGAHTPNHVRNAEQGSDKRTA